MPNTILSPNMSLPVPVVGVDPGPQYATDINSCLTILDGHNHSNGSGVPITSSGLNINIDLPINNNNLLSIKSARFTVQPAALVSASDISSLYTVVNATYGSDLYFNTENGGIVPIVTNGTIAGAPGNISGLIAPASVSYSSISQTFVFQATAATAANLDAGSVIIREQIASARGVTLSSPIALASNYTITLPATLPSSPGALVIDSSGTLSSSPGTFMPTGAIMPFAGASAPAGYLLADGSAVSRTTFASLFAVCGTTYGGGDGTTTFNVPSLGGRVPLGNNGTYARGSSGGASTHTLVASELPVTAYSDSGHSHTFTGISNVGDTTNTPGTLGIFRTAGDTAVSTSNANISNPGGGNAHNNMQPYLSVNYIIKT